MTTPYTTALAAVIHQEVMTAIRSGMSLPSVIATLGAEIERMQIALPYLKATHESDKAP